MVVAACRKRHLYIFFGDNMGAGISVIHTLHKALNDGKEAGKSDAAILEELKELIDPHHLEKIMEIYEEKKKEGYTLDELIEIEEREHDTKPRAVVGVDVENKIFKTTRQVLTKDTFAFSHRWEVRDTAETWQVHCDDEAPYPCKIYPAEVVNIESFLNEAGNGTSRAYIDFWSKELWNGYISVCHGCYIEGSCRVVH